MNDERRKHSRIAFQTPATLIFPDRKLDVVVIDLSLKGALVTLPAGTSVDAASDCRLQVYLDREHNDITMETSIIHVEGENAGLLCLAIDLDSVTHLRRLVELNLGDPALLERELSALIADGRRA